MSAISLFEEKQVRRAWNPSEEKWYFSIDDVVLALTDYANVKDYIKKLRKRDPALDSYCGTNCPPVEMIAADRKKRKIKAANTESLFRINQSIPSPTKTTSTAFSSATHFRTNSLSSKMIFSSSNMMCRLFSPSNQPSATD
jgi:hypothetical protein